MFGRSLRIGLIGYGHWGPNYARSMDAVEGASLTWCVDASAEALERARAACPNVRLSRDVDDVLNAPDCDAVIVTTNPSQHYAVAKRILAARKPLLVEKPLATDEAGAAALATLAERQNVITVAGHVYLFNPVTRAISSRLRSGKLGRIRLLTASRMFTRLASSSTRPDVDALWDLAPNDIAMFVCFAGGPPQLVSAVRSAHFRTDQADAYVVILRWRSGIVGELRVSWDYPFRERLVGVVGSRGTLLFDDDAAEKLTLYDDASGTAGTPNGQRLAYGSESPVVRQLRHFVTCVKTGTKSPVDFRYGASIVRILAAIDEAALEGTTVRLDTQPPEG
ncbi:MAG: Gfo/Idh/MocA family oxidoreductase [Candidatus Tumulicola sp.]